jgi:hypothetical protein
LNYFHLKPTDLCFRYIHDTIIANLTDSHFIQGIHKVFVARVFARFDDNIQVTRGIMLDFYNAVVSIKKVISKRPRSTIGVKSIRVDIRFERGFPEWVGGCTEA